MHVEACNNVFLGGVTLGLHVVLYAALLLLPLVPAYVIYKNFPARTNLNGAFFGFTLKAGGAFAGYLALFLFLILPKQNMVNSGERIISSIQQPAWKISADVGFKNRLNQDDDPNSYIDNLSFETSPELLEHRTQHITMWVPDKAGELPQVILTAGKYRAVVHLKNEIEKWQSNAPDTVISSFDQTEKKIELKSILMREPPCKGCYGSASTFDLPKISDPSEPVKHDAPLSEPNISHRAAGKKAGRPK